MIRKDLHLLLTSHSTSVNPRQAQKASFHTVTGTGSTAAIGILMRKAEDIQNNGILLMVCFLLSGGKFFDLVG
jgi:Xaa-Pro aminopeptidase